MSRFADEDAHEGGHEYEYDETRYDGDAIFGGDAEADPMPPSTRRRGSGLKNTLAILVSLVVLLGGGYLVYSAISGLDLSFTNSADDYPGPGVDPVVVEIPAGATLTDIANVLYGHDVVASPQAFVNAAQANPDAASIQAGTYQLLTQMKASDAVAALIDRENMILNQVTIPEGLPNSQVIERINEVTGIPLADLQAELDNPANLGLPEWSQGATEGFLFPQTYAHGLEPTAAEILSQMTAQFITVTDDLNFVARAGELGVSPYDAVTVASIIEKETRNPEDGPNVAQVIYNRLRIGMRLQMDSTVHYVANSYGEITTTDEQRASDSPYNTYVHGGLPPGAIANPGENALNSAVSPTQGDYLYFVTVNPDTGETRFAADEEGHAANVAEFQSWCRANSDRCG